MKTYYWTDKELKYYQKMACVCIKYLKDRKQNFESNLKRDGEGILHPKTLESFILVL
jgi:hypothetical protein